jgi:hypothetical protein
MKSTSQLADRKRINFSHNKSMIVGTMNTQRQIYTDSDYLQAHMTAVGAHNGWIGSFNQNLMELLRRWGSRIFAVILAF